MAEVKREDWRAAMVICAVVNVHRTREDGALEPSDLMPWLAEPKEAARSNVATPEQTRVWFEELTLAMGGIVHERNRPLSG